MDGKRVDENGEVEVKKLPIDVSVQTAFDRFGRPRLLEYPPRRPSGIGQKSLEVIFFLLLLKRILDPPDLVPVVGMLFMQDLIGQGESRGENQNTEGSGQK